MTNILGNIGFSFTGRLGISLNGSVVDDSTTPDTVYLKNYERFFNITNGVITSASFPETETSGVSAHISIYELDTQDPPQIILPAFYEFDAIIPSAVSVEFSQLIPTGVVNQQLDTSALRIAKLIANDPALAQKVAGAPYPRGEYDSGATYLYGEMVSYFGKNYISKSLSPIVGIIPTNTASWYELVITLPPEVSVIATGDNSVYGVSWNGSLLVPTQNSVYDKVVTIDAAIATANTNITNLTSGKADLSSVNSQFTTVNTNITNLNTGKADLSYVNTQLATKADITTVNTQLAAKADTTAVNTQLATKADVTYVNNFSRPIIDVEVNSVQTQTASAYNVQFGLENIDTNNVFSGSTFTVPITGTYLLGGLLIVINNAGLPYQFNAEYFINGSTARRAGTIVLGAGAGSGLTLSPAILNLTAGNTLVIRVVPSATISFTIQTNSYLSIMRIA